jgi:hypothetical protein
MVSSSHLSLMPEFWTSAKKPSKLSSLSYTTDLQKALLIPNLLIQELKAKRQIKRLILKL